MSMIKRGKGTKEPAVSIVKEKKSENNYCCYKCKKCFNSLQEMESHDCSKK